MLRKPKQGIEASGAASNRAKTTGDADRRCRYLHWLFTGDDEQFYRKLQWRTACSPEIFYDEEMERRVALLKKKMRAQ